MQSMICGESKHIRESKMVSHYSKYCESINRSLSIGKSQLKADEQFAETAENNKNIEEKKEPKVIHLSKYRYLFEDSKLVDSKLHLPIII